MINVLIADDHKIVVDGLTSILKNEKDIKIVGTGKNGLEALEIVKNNTIDIVILDINMPELNGIEATKKIKDISPESKVLILSMYNDREFIDELLQAGCSGYILKNKGQEELVKAIRTILGGNDYLGEEIIKTIIKGRREKKNERITLPIHLTKRETEVLKLIAQEYTAPEIAEQLFIEETTVNTHRRNLISKLKVKNSLGLVSYAFKNGLVE